jgi:hypothetical protein
MSLAGVFLWFILVAPSETQPQQVWRAEIKLDVSFPDGVWSPITVQVKEPLDASLTIEDNSGDRRYIVTSRTKFSHVLLAVSAYSFDEELVNTGAVSWNGAQTYLMVAVTFRNGNLPSIRKVDIVQHGSGFEIAIFNPYEGEILITNLSLSGRKSFPVGVAQGQLTSWVYEIRATVTGKQVHGTVREKSLPFERDVVGSYVDGGTGAAVSLEFNPGASVHAKENSTLTIFPTITGSSLQERGIGLSRPVISPNSNSIMGMINWEFTVVFNEQLSVTKKCEKKDFHLECR